MKNVILILLVFNLFSCVEKEANEYEIFIGKIDKDSLTISKVGEIVQW